MHMQELQSKVIFSGRPVGCINFQLISTGFDRFARKTESSFQLGVFEFAGVKKVDTIFINMSFSFFSKIFRQIFSFSINLPVKRFVICRESRLGNKLDRFAGVDFVILNGNFQLKTFFGGSKP